MPKRKPTAEQLKARKAAKKAEKKRRAEEHRKQIEYNHLQREIKYGELWMQKQEKVWYNILMDIELPYRRTEMEYAWHNFERIIDAKDFTMSLLLDELRDAEEQYQRNTRSHIDNIDKLIILCHDQIEELNTESKKVILNLYNAAIFERADIVGITKENEEFLKTMLYMLDNSRKESEKYIRGEYLSKQEVEISKLDDIRMKFTEDLQGKFDKMWKDSQSFLKRYRAHINIRKTEYTELLTQDDATQKIIRKQWRTFLKHWDTIKMLKMKMADREKMQSRKLYDLNRERAHYEGVYKTLKKKLVVDRKLDNKQLTILTLKSNIALKWLAVIEVKGEKMLKLSAICRKYESQQEKTLAFPLFGEEIIEKTPRRKRKVVDTFKPEMGFFANRVGDVNSSRFEMDEECAWLRRRNRKLQGYIHDYCKCLNCDEENQYFMK